jgi:hypothetical protein
MIRSGYEAAVHPDLERRGRADESVSCGVQLPLLLGAREPRTELSLERQLESSEVHEVA